MIRDNVADGLADLCAALGLLENFRTDIGKPHIPRRPLEQPDAQLILGSVTRRLTIEIGILGRFAASEKLLVSTTLANIASELRSIIVVHMLSATGGFTAPARSYDRIRRGE